MDKKRQKILHELDRETEYYSDHTRRQYFSHAQDYLAYVGDGDWQDRDILYNYMKRLKTKHSQSHANYLVRGPIGALFRAHGLKIPIKLPRVQVSLDITDRIQFSSEEIGALITSALDSGNIQYQAIMAISTIYYPRASEILDIRKDDVHPKKNTIVIRTKKYGLKREHLVPVEIKPYIFGYTYPFISERQLREVFGRVLKLAGVDRISGKSYHAVRHGVITALRYEAHLSDGIIDEFTGWRPAGTQGGYARRFPFMPKTDEEVFSKHPFLKYWV